MKEVREKQCAVEFKGVKKIPIGKEGVIMNRRFEQGFTLIEMLIVLVVISIIIGVVLPNFRGTQDEASIQRAKSDLRTIATAIESYYIHQNNATPAALSNLITASPTILNVVPDDPFRSGSNDYSYFTDTNNTYYVVFAYGVGRTATITGISTAGALAGTVGDDVCITNGTTAC